MFEKRDLVVNILIAIVLGIVLILNLLFVGCGSAVQTEQKIGESITAFDKGAHLLHIDNKLTRIADYAAALHEAGVDKEVLEAIHNAVEVAHQVAEEHAEAHPDVEVLE